MKELRKIQLDSWSTFGNGEKQSVSEEAGISSRKSDESVNA